MGENAERGGENGESESESGERGWRERGEKEERQGSEKGEGGGKESGRERMGNRWGRVEREVGWGWMDGQREGDGAERGIERDG